MNFFNKKVTIEEETLGEKELEKEFEEEEEGEEERCKAGDYKIDNCEDDDIQWVS